MSHSLGNRSRCPDALLITLALDYLLLPVSCTWGTVVSASYTPSHLILTKFHFPAEEIAQNHTFVSGETETPIHVKTIGHLSWQLIGKPSGRSVP